MEEVAQDMVIPTERIAEEPDDTTSSVEDPESSSISNMYPSAQTCSRSVLPSPTYTRTLPPSPASTRFHGKAKKTMDREPPYNGFGVVYLPGDINVLTKKLHLLAAEFFAGYATARNELVHVLGALLRLKQLTRKEYADITARFAASL